MILSLKNGQSFFLSLYEEFEGYISLQIPNCVTSLLLAQCTEENLSEVKIVDDKGKIISEYLNLSLDTDIGYSIKFNQTSFKLAKYSLPNRLSDAKEALAQAQADIAYLSAMTGVEL